ncbi:M48 family metalloprotease [Novosphingobium beihaiensis]|uniref:M48 family metalloprotease n=1 Tax=Novosphingobium beihaiensis TaxID=2930389 RepID=A0ABT0BVW1_9SPHN|nr:M48 family metalloprotease [Novosphingobium beihaiensis]MCJ2189215.1 M48 family metalloprotease [Novosphingobium beihaiensis]
MALAATTLSPVAASAQQARSISMSERAQGDKVNPQLVAEYGGRYDGPQAAFVERVGKQVAVQSGLANAGDDFTVQLLNSSIENAFAIPGGYVYVTRQLLALMNNEDELAFVMGHEVGHVAARHSAGRRQTSAIGGLLAGIVGAVAGKSDFGQLLGAGAQQASKLYTLKFGRDQEYQADTLGVRYVIGAGYDPWGAPEVLAQLDASSKLQARTAGRQANATPTWLSTHPSNAKRVARARALAQQTQRDSPARAPQDAAFLRMLDGMRYDDDPAKGVIDGQTFRQPTLRIRFTAPQGYSISNTDDAVTVSGARGQAQLRMAAGISRLDAAVVEGFRKLGGQLSANQVRQTTINDRKAAVASLTATANRQRLDATVLAIQFPGAMYVWTMVTPPGDGAATFTPMIAGFTTMTAAEAGQVGGKHIRIHSVRQGETIDSLSKRMAYPDFQRERFVMLNGIDPNLELRPGMLVKLVERD